MMIKALVVDDELPARELLKHYLGQMGKVQIAAECDDGDKAVEVLSRQDFAVVFLDIRMGRTDGLTVAREINRRFSDVQIVFTTGFSEYAVEAFEVNAVDYIMKPYSKARLQQTIDKIMRDKERVSRGKIDLKTRSPRPAGKAQEVITVWANDRMVVVPYADIIYCQAKYKEQASIATKDNNFTVKIALRGLEDKLGLFGFLRVHKSFIVNLDSIKEIIPWFNDTYILTVNGSLEKIPVSRHYIKIFNQAMGIRG